MPYINRQCIESIIPAPLLNTALDDDRDGVADDGLLDTILEGASNAVDALVTGRFTVPMSDPPAFAREAAFYFACERIYDRRQCSQPNPFRDRADYWRNHLAQIGNASIPPSPRKMGQPKLTDPSDLSDLSDRSDPPPVPPFFGFSFRQDGLDYQPRWH